MRRFVEQTLRDLVAIESVNPKFAGPRSGPGGEARIIDYLETLLRGWGWHTEVLATPTVDRPSLVAHWAGSGGGRSLMLNGHVDTVGVETMDRPFEPRVESGRLYGRGAYDMKGGVTACLAAAREISRRETPLGGDLWLTAVADEEEASAGARAVAEKVHTDGVIVTEPTHLVPTIAHKGFVWIAATTRGFACHGSRSDLGVDANRRAAAVLTALDHLERERSALSHPLLGSPSLHLGRIDGGLGPSIYSPSCRMTIELRTLPGESTADLLDRLRRLIGDAAPDAANEPDLELLLSRPPLEAAAEGALVRAVSSALAAILPDPAPPGGVAYWTDAALFAKTSGEVLLLGPSGAGAHEDVEWVDLDSVVETAHALCRTAETYCA